MGLGRVNRPGIGAAPRNARRSWWPGQIWLSMAGGRGHGVAAPVP